MNFFQKVKKQQAIPTCIKYFLSYLLIFTVLIMGSYFIIRHQLMKGYFEQRIDYAKSQLDNMARQLNDRVIFLSQVEASLNNNETLRANRYQTEEVSAEQVYKELREYEDSSEMISSIVYMPRLDNEVFSTRLPVTWENGIFCIEDTTQNTLTFDPSLYLDASTGQLVFVSGGNQEYLLYFPAISSQAGYICFYILDTAEIQMQLKSFASEEMFAVAMIDADGRIIKGVNSSELLANMDSWQPKSGIYGQKDESTMCVSNEISNGYSLVAMVSNEFLMEQITVAFATTWLALVVLSVIGFALVLVAMRITYQPLYRLTQKIIPDSDFSSAHLSRLENTFSEVTQQNQQLKDKLDNYRFSIQKSLLDSFVGSGELGEEGVFSDIERLFDKASDKKIYVIHIASGIENIPKGEFRDFIRKTIPDMEVSILLDNRTDKTSFLVNYTGTETDKESLLKKQLYRFYEEYGCMVAISNGSDSPLDIPFLYENAMRASNSWPQSPVAEYKPLPQNSDSPAYPHDKLNELSVLLTDKHFEAGKALISELLQMTDRCILAESSLHSFFAPCMLIDILMIITNCMNQSGINFSIYSDLYYETLYYCRSCPYTLSKKEDIADNFERLLEIYERENLQKLLSSEPFRKTIEEYYCQPDFSIAMLAETFQVSVSYMSYLFKKEMNMTFSDYLWMLRLKRAKELLCTTTMSIDEISITVGYYSVSSFRRKFKHATGYTPSEFRESRGL